jgi:hypothetical protein
VGSWAFCEWQFAEAIVPPQMVGLGVSLVSMIVGSYIGRWHFEISDEFFHIPEIAPVTDTLAVAMEEEKQKKKPATAKKAASTKKKATAKTAKKKAETKEIPAKKPTAKKKTTKKATKKPA